MVLVGWKLVNPEYLHVTHLYLDSFLRVLAARPCSHNLVYQAQDGYIGYSCSACRSFHTVQEELLKAKPRLWEAIQTSPLGFLENLQLRYRLRHFPTLWDRLVD